MGRVLKTGLSWAEVEVRARHMAECRALDEAATDQLWHDVSVLERAALACMAHMREIERDYE